MTLNRSHQSASEKKMMRKKENVSPGSTSSPEVVKKRGNVSAVAAKKESLIAMNIDIKGGLHLTRKKRRDKNFDYQKNGQSVPSREKRGGGGPFRRPAEEPMANSPSRRAAGSVGGEKGEDRIGGGKGKALY